LQVFIKKHHAAVRCCEWVGYYNQDYTAIGGSGAAAMAQAVYQHPGNTDNTGRQLFNGNISHTEVALSKIDNGAAKGYSYGYDQLNRLLYMNQHTISGNTWSNSNIITAYAESIAYDANGNILQYQRKGANGAAGPLDMDSLNYKYNRDVNGNIINNRLNHVRDAISNSNYTVDIDNQNSNNYTYDKIGNLKTDAAENINTINWTVYGKIKTIAKPTAVIEYGYDAGGNRTHKKVIPATLEDEKNTWYIRDAQGNTLAVYSQRNNDPITWDEQHLYGSSRLGMWNWDTTVPGKPPVVASNNSPIYDSLLCGSRTYELSNHLGNVLVTVSDKKIGVDNNSDGVIDYYTADVVTANDFYPGGMTMPGRKYENGTSYRYGFNGKEEDNEISGDGNKLDFGSRIFDSRLVRWLSTDPLQAKYPFASPYNFVLNNPISFIDPDGKDIIIGENYANTHFWTTFLNKTFDGNVQFKIETDAEGVHRLKLDLLQGKSFKSETQRKAYEYIKSIADNSSTNVKIMSGGIGYSLQESHDPNISHLWHISADDYKDAEFNEQIVGVTKVDGFGYNGIGTSFIHFLAEQYSAQVDQKLTQSHQRNDWNYIQAHEDALKKGVEIFGYSWAPRVDIPNGKRLAEDWDIIDKDGNYVTTLRMIHDFRGKKPKFSTTTFQRKDLQAGQKWKPIIDNNSTQQDRRKYSETYPIDRDTTPSSDKPQKQKSRG
jgi:RHS repeat-associated protein